MNKIDTPLRRLRKVRKWTQRDLARIANVHENTIASIEAGKPCRQHIKRRLLIALGLPWESKGRVFDD